MKKNKKRLLKTQDNKLDIHNVAYSVTWEPLSLLRWKKVEIDDLMYIKVLQQLWKGDKGEQEWRDVPEED